MNEPVIAHKDPQTNAGASGSIEVEAIPREFFLRGAQSIMMVIRSGDREGLTVSQIAEMTNISERAVRQHLSKHAITAVAILPQSLRTLKDAGVLLVHARSAMFVSKQDVQKLLRHIGTPESLAIYYQLWNNSEKLHEAEKKLLETVGQLKAALDRSALDQAKIRMQEQQFAQLEAKLQAAIEHMEHKGKGKRQIRHCVVDIEFAGVNIFEGPQYRVSAKKLEMAEMSGREKDVFGLQRGISSIRGIAGSMQERMTRMEVSNPEIMGALKDLSTASDVAYHKLVPEAGLVFGVGSGKKLEFMN